MLTAEKSREQKGLPMMPERIDLWCWDDIVRRRSPDISGGQRLKKLGCR